jgi:transposase
MPWKERSVMDERMRFVIRLKDGETMASLCREFGISRKTGYKIFERYEQCGLEGLSDRTRRPFRYANQLPEQVEAAIVSAKREKPHWGARKIRERLLRRLPHAIKTPAASTIHAVLDRHGLVQSIAWIVSALQAFGVVAAPRHLHRAHPSRPSPTERPA